MISLDNSNMIFDLQSIPYGENGKQCIIYNGAENINSYDIHGCFRPLPYDGMGFDYQTPTNDYPKRIILAEPFLGKNGTVAYGFRNESYSNTDIKTRQGIFKPVHLNLSITEYDTIFSTPPNYINIQYYYMEEELEKILSTSSTIRYLCFIARYKFGAIDYMPSGNKTRDFSDQDDLDTCTHLMILYEIPTDLSQSNSWKNIGWSGQNSQRKIFLYYSGSELEQILLGNVNDNFLLNEYTFSLSGTSPNKFFGIGYYIKQSFDTDVQDSVDSQCYYLRGYVLEKSVNDPLMVEDCFKLAKDQFYEDSMIYIQKK